MKVNDDMKLNSYVDRNYMMIGKIIDMIMIMWMWINSYVYERLHGNE